MLVGPVSYVLEQLQQIGWKPLPDGMVVDHADICWSVTCNSSADINDALYDAWVQVILAHIRRDVQCQGLTKFSVTRTRQMLGDAKKYIACQANYVVGAIKSTEGKSVDSSP